MNRLYSGFLPRLEYQPGYPCRNSLLWVWIMQYLSVIVHYWAVGLVLTQTCSSTLQHPKPNIQRQLVTVTAHFLKGSAGSWSYWQTKWTNSFTLFPQVSIVSWYFPLTLVTFLVTRVLRSASCSPSAAFTLGMGVTLGYWLKLSSLKSESGLILRSNSAFLFTFKLAITHNNSQGIGYFCLFIISLHFLMHQMKQLSWSWTHV